MRTVSIVALIALFAMACSDTERAQPTAGATSAAPATTTLTPEQLGELGAAIKKNPDNAQSLLSEKGLNDQSFEQAIRKLSEDPAASARYAEAYKRASGT